MRLFAAYYSRFVIQHLRFLGFERYQIALTVLLLAAFCGIAFLASGSRAALVNRLCPPWLYSLLMVGALFVIRLPTLLPGSMNPDESMLLAGALKLRSFPVFWQSLDGTTSGPLNYYPLTLLNLVGFPLNYATARLLNVICIGAAIAILYLIARLYLPDWCARLTPLPALAAAMTFRSQDFLHYSSECVSILLIALATWALLADGASHRATWLRSVVIGVLVVFIPLAKLQAVPMAAVIALGMIALAWFGERQLRWPRGTGFAAGLCAATASLLAFLLGFHQWGTFQQTYIKTNLLYADAPPPMSLRHFIGFCLARDVEWFEGGILLCLLATAAILYLSSRRPKAIVPRLLFPDLFSLGLLLASVYAVYRPARNYPHYLLFLIFPLSFAGVRALVKFVEVSQKTNVLAGLRPALLFVLLTLVAPSLLRIAQLRWNPQPEGWMAGRRARLDCAACDLVSHLAKPGDPITVWGWTPEVYVLTNTIPATRDTLTYWQILPSPLQGYYRSRFLEDLQRDPPKVFVDGVAPHQFHFHERVRFGYETFPALRQYVASNFDLAGEVAGVRVFTRKNFGAITSDPRSTSP